MKRESQNNQGTIPTGFSTMTSSVEYADNYNSWILKEYKPFIGKNILEIGTGQGNFKKYLKSSCSNYVSIDIDGDVINRAIQRDPEGIYLNISITDPECVNVLKQYKFDTIICFNVIEHISEAEVAISNMIEILASKGNLLLFVPAFPSLYNSMDQLAGHFRRYTKESLVKSINSNKSIISKMEYFNFIGGIGWYFNKLIKHKDLDSKSLNTQMKFFDKFIVPFSKLINPITKNIFGQSLLLVLNKK
ncbi:MAG: class I SAM-dependent methyltransferase [Bacteroidales bacterium]|nr:class I SAM-dependent methyltransferase [Bacteroidales bacterium]